MTEIISNKLTMYIEEMIQTILDEKQKEALEYQHTTHLENGIESQNRSPHARIFTVEELAEYLKVSKPTAYDLTKQEGVPSFRVGKSIRVDANELDN